MAEGSHRQPSNWRCACASDLSGRLGEIEKRLAALDSVVSTERLVIGTELLGPGLVAELVGESAELRLVAGGLVAGSLVIRAGSATVTDSSTIAVALFGDGEPLCEIGASRGTRRWSSHLYLA